jgi:hypothetical protein
MVGDIISGIFEKYSEKKGCFFLRKQVNYFKNVVNKI